MNIHILGYSKQFVFSLINAFSEHHIYLYNQNENEHQFLISSPNFSKKSIKDFHLINSSKNDVIIIADPLLLLNNNRYECNFLLENISTSIPYLEEIQIPSTNSNLMVKGRFNHLKDEKQFYNPNKKLSSNTFLQKHVLGKENYKAMFYIDEYIFQSFWRVHQERFSMEEELIAIESVEKLFSLNSENSISNSFRGFFTFNIVFDGSDYYITSIRTIPMPIFQFIKENNIDIFNLTDNYVLEPGHKVLFETKYFSW